MDPRLAFSYLNVPLIPIPDLPKAMEELLDAPGHTRTPADPFAMPALDPQETKAHDETCFGVLPSEATTFTTTQHATHSHPLTTSQYWQQHQQQEYGHYDSSYNNNGLAFNSSTSNVQNEQLDNFTVAGQATANPNPLETSRFSGLAARDDDGFLNPNVVLPLTRNAGSSSANSRITFSQSATPSSSRSTSVVSESSRPPSVAPPSLNVFSHAHRNVFSPSPTPPLTRSGSVMSRRSQNIATPSPVATPFIHDGQLSFFPPHARDNHVHNEPMMYPPEGSVAGPSTIPVYQPDLNLVQSVGPCRVNPHTHHGAVVHWDNTSHPASQWQQANLQETFPAPVQTHYYSQAPRVWQGEVVQYINAPQQAPTVLQQPPAHQNAPPRASSKKKSKTSRPKVKKPSARATSRTDALGEPTVAKGRFPCPDCGNHYSSKKVMERHYENDHEHIRRFCPNPTCEHSVHAKNKLPEELGIPRLDSLLRHVDEQCSDWFDVFDAMYPLKNGKKRKRRGKGKKTLKKA
ncbi:hypothetical protein SCHPADRAFT_894449 [Schizopora paradoxa]|uniref:C2H2-type domain-containing protein n=1 Tax=Schizopora paradoxa TaxID=27342 RepID=A0A0H2RS70_9AGAM|nr:hypothetical protein SCHPADRAFT_894449 [Schizopora paradoxa]